MKIVNKTRWCTKHLRNIIKQVAKEECVSLKGAFFSPNCPSGFAYYRSVPNVTLKLPAVKYGINKVALAKVIAHELAHCQGVHHRAMLRTSRYRWGGKWQEIFAWADKLALETKE